MPSRNASYAAHVAACYADKMYRYRGHAYSMSRALPSLAENTDTTRNIEIPSAKYHVV